MAKSAKKDAVVLTRDVFEKADQKIDMLETEHSKTSSLRKKVYEEFEPKGLHKEAFKLVRKLKKMNAGSRADFLRGFDAMRGFADLDAQGDLIDEKKKPELKTV